MSLDLKTREQIVQDEISAVQSALPGNFQFPIGSIVLAIVEAHAGTALWEEALVQFVLARIRLATSTGKDCDTFIADFGLVRLPAIPATGNVTFTSFSAVSQRIIGIYNFDKKLGTLISTEDGSQFFGVIADTTNIHYNSALQAYVMPVGTFSINALVQAVIPGAAGNVTDNTITVINSPVTGVDSVNNVSAFTNGVDVQSDPALRTYFVQYINSLSRATEGALGFAISSIQQGIKYSLVENVNYTTGNPELGYFYAVVDDGTYAPSMGFLALVAANVELYRGFTIRYDIKAPIITNINITATVILPLGLSLPTLSSDVSNALSLYISLIPLGETLFYTRVAQIIYNVVMTDAPTFIDDINVTTILVNSGTSDITSDKKHEFRPNTITVTVINA